MVLKPSGIALTIEKKPWVEPVSGQVDGTAALVPYEEMRA